MPVFNSQFKAKVKLPKNQPMAFLEYLSLRFTYKTREEWEKLIEEKLAFVEGKTSSPHSLIHNEDVICFKVVDYQEPEVPTDIKLLAREKDLWVYHKPMGLPVHKTGRVFFNTMVNLVREKTSNPGLSPIHRLDQETGGLVFFQNEAGSKIKKIKIHKWYMAYVWGRPEKEEGYIEFPLDTLEDSAIRCQMHHVSLGKPSTTYYQLLESDGKNSCILAFPVTGRKHQIRAHLSLMGCPIVGDKIYSEQGKFFLERLKRELTELDYEALGAEQHQLFCFGALANGEGKQHNIWLDKNLQGLLQKPKAVLEEFMNNMAPNFLLEKTRDIIGGIGASTF